jgi:CspA family cold shock protein
MVRPGTVTWFNDHKGYGFIRPDEGADVFVHHSAIQMEGYRTLRAGMQVEFELSDDREAPRARKASLVKIL